MENVYIAIQARLGSTRLPKKISLPIGDYNSIVEAVATKWKKISNYPVYILAPELEKNDIFWKKIKKKHNIFFGNTHNLIKRYLAFANFINAKTIVRITADNPFIHKKILDISIKSHFDSFSDYTSSKRDDGANIPIGLGIEIFQIEALEQISKTKKKSYQEHVSEAFIQNSTLKINIIENPFNLSDDFFKKFSFTIDFEDEYDFWQNII